MHGLVGRDGPEGVEVDVDDQEPQDEGQGRQLGFESDGDQDDEDGSHHVLQDLQHDGRGEARCGVDSDHLFKVL